jgi:hypothetical protein
MMSDTGELVELVGVKSSNDLSIYEFGLGITCGRHGLETEGRISLCNINGVVWSGYSLLTLAGLSYLIVLWARRISEAYSANRLNMSTL